MSCWCLRADFMHIFKFVRIYFHAIYYQQMPFGGHIDDIARQGIWASLTGGWYYEPAHSLLCNTLHLYLWTILFVLPILLGILASGGNAQLGLGACLAYLAAVGTIFILIKLVVSFLHHIFDTVQPIKYKSRRSVVNRADEQSQQQRHYRAGRFSGSSFSATRATESNAIDMIEMLEMHPQRMEQDVQTDDADEEFIKRDIEQHRSDTARYNAASQYHRDRSPRYLSLPRNASASMRLQRSLAEDEGEHSSSSSSASSKCSAHGLLALESSEVRLSRRGRGTILRTTDSLDLLPIASGRQQNRMPMSERGQKLSRLHQRRKYSEPCSMTFACSSSVGGSVGRGWRKQRRRRRSEERHFAIRRVNSTSMDVERDSEKKGKRTSLLLPKTGSLGTHFPGGILVDELELNRWNFGTSQSRASQRKQQQQRRQQLVSKKEEEETEKLTANNKQNDEEPTRFKILDDEKDEKKEEKTMEDIEQQQPCCSTSILKKDDEQPSSSDHLLAVQQYHDRPSTSQALTASLNALELGGPLSSGANSEDLKGQITKFLEELIEKHPDTLMDAIQSVQMNRLFQMGPRHQQRGGPAAESQQQQLMASKILPSSAECSSAILSESLITTAAEHSQQQQQKHHLAVDPTDTTQGAVHAFQDDKGNWFTYWFGTQSTGIAQPLVTANEMFQEQQQQQQRRPLFHRNQHRQLVRTEAQQQNLPIALEHSSSSASRFGGEQHQSSSSILQQLTDTDLRMEEEEGNNGHCQPTTVNVMIHRKRSRSASSSSLSSIKVPADGRVVPSSRSSSSDSVIRFPRQPSNVFRAGAIGAGSTSAIGAGGTSSSMDEGRPTGRGGGGPAQALQRIHNAHGRQLSDSSRQLIAFMQRICQGAAENPEFRARIMAPPGRIARQPRVRADSDVAIARNYGQQDMANIMALTPSAGSPSMNTVRLLNDLQMNRTLPPPFLFNFSRADMNRSRLKYCYRLKMPSWLSWWPFGGNAKPTEPGEAKPRREFKLKLDRLSLAALFDRNVSPVSCVFDVFLALLVALLAAMMLFRQIYTEMSLVAFAFVVVGAQFSLLKSVQPDSASPVHGFNFLVAYSRPLYFCAIAFALLLLDWAVPALLPNVNLTWKWRPFWLHLYHDRPFVVSPRDLCANALLILPIAFTLGLLPQVNTLCMHLLEQLDMHLFGGTAAFTLLSACFALGRSCATFGISIGLFRLVQHFWPNQTVNTVGFSAFTSITLTLAYLLSRASSNPLFLHLISKSFWTCCSGKHQNTADEPKERQREKESSPRNINPPLNTSDSTLTAPTNKQLLRCCFSTQSDTVARSRRNRTGLEENGEQQKAAEQILMSERDQQLQQQKEDDELLSGISMHTLLLRSQHDLFSAIIRTLLLFGVHCTSVFQIGQPHLERVLALLCILVGVINHHVYPQLRAKYPWKIFAQPFLRPFEFHQFETVVEAKLTVFERVHVWMLSMEKNFFYPLLFASLMTTSGANWNLSSPAEPNGTNSFCLQIMLILCTFRLSRTAFAQPQQLYVPLLATCFVYSDRFGYIKANNASTVTELLHSSPIICFFLLTILWSKLIELLLKVHFILCYLAPWQISWGSAFHAFAQPFSVPHSGLILAQAVISSILSAPLNPFLGSSFFLMSYVRPVKFWERDYNTKRVDHSKLRLASQLDRGPMVDDSNLNAIFYEHLTRSLQKWLAGDLLLGRWACSIRPGDCFILASNYLNCMVQLVEIGNGFVTFQLRGLEFRGTYCHQREMEAISEDWADANGACCCCMLGRLPGMISFNNAWTLRWLAWEVTVAKYVVDGYSISDNSAVNMLQVHELRRLLVTLYVKCMLYYAINSTHFDIWLSDETILKALDPIRQNARFVDPDPMFCAANDEDYDLNLGGLSRQSFTFFYGDWIEHCLLSRCSPLALRPPTKTEGTAANGNPLTQLANDFCFALSILGRRALGTAAYNRHANAAESFLFGMHALFKGDMRITNPADEWVFTDPEILTKVISPAVRMALKLHQDHFAALVDLDEPAELYERITSYKEKIFISHEHDPAWRRAILENTSSLLALRHICDDGQDDYKVIMLNKRHLDMRVIKLNRECVRAFWAGQQQELIFLRNKNPERGSIQNARQVLRNMINSSADQPIGYPIYVSPLVTSFVETHPQLSQVLGPTLTFSWCWQSMCSLFARLRTHFGPSGSSSAAQQQQQQSIPLAVFPSSNPQQQMPPPPLFAPPPVPPHQSTSGNGKKEKKNNGQAKDDEEKGGTTSKLAVAQIVEQIAALKVHNTIPTGRERRQPSLSHSHLGVVEDSAIIAGEMEELHVARRSSAADATATSGLSSSNAVPDELSGHQRNYGMRFRIEDFTKVLSRLNEPRRTSGECLVKWPSEQWRLKGGINGWPHDWQTRTDAVGTLVHRWIPFHPEQAFRSHAGHICLIEMKCPDNGEHWYVPVLEEGTRREDEEKTLFEELKDTGHSWVMK